MKYRAHFLRASWCPSCLRGEALVFSRHGFGGFVTSIGLRVSWCPWWLGGEKFFGRGLLGVLGVLRGEILVFSPHGAPAGQPRIAMN
jgi:hypothetical protein